MFQRIIKIFNVRFIVNNDENKKFFSKNDDNNFSNSQNNNNNYNQRFYINKIDFFDFFFDNKSAFIELLINNSNKNYIFKNVYVFLNQIKNITFIKK